MAPRCALGHVGTDNMIKIWKIAKQKGYTDELAVTLPANCGESRGANPDSVLTRLACFEYISGEETKNKSMAKVFERRGGVWQEGATKFTRVTSFWVHLRGT